MKIVTLLALMAVASAEFSCIKPVNPIPAGPPGVCCEKLDQNALLGFLYTGKTCMSSLRSYIQDWDFICEKKGIAANGFELKASEPIKWMKPRVERQPIALVKMGEKQLVVTRYAYIEWKDTPGRVLVANL